MAAITKSHVLVFQGGDHAEDFAPSQAGISPLSDGRLRQLPCLRRDLKIAAA
jgi:hypothetical protein